MVYFKKLMLLSIILLFVSSTDTFSQVKAESVAVNTNTDFKYDILEKSFSKVDNVSISNKENLIKELEKVNFVNGNIYFSGAGFKEVVAVSFTGNSLGALLPYSDRIVSGTQITFENCTIKNADGSLIKKFQKAIFFY